jgi:hypothetical protein
LNRELLTLQYRNLNDTLSIFAGLNFSDAGNTFVDDEVTDGDRPYYLFPTSNAKNGGWDRGGGVTDPLKYVVDTGSYGFFNSLKAAAIILNKTDAIVAGTELGGFDTHSGQGGPTGAHARLQQRIAWAVYGLRKYFANYSDRASWDDLVVVTLSEFGRTTVQNSDFGTDHAEAGAMFISGGSIKGYGQGNSSAVFGCSPGDAIPWVTGPTGSMYGVSTRYLKRAYDYRSIMGKLIRDHLGATQAQLDRIIPGYADVTRERLLAGGLCTIDNTQIMGEPNLI